MNKKIEISAGHLILVKEILSRYLPSASAWVFGSRARGGCKPYSDLDIAIDNQSARIPMSILAAIAFDFEESELPYKVDVVDWNSIDKSFQENIKKDLVLI